MIQQTAFEAPVVEFAEEAAAWCRGTAAEPLTGTPTILFVEDEAFVREVTTEVLTSAGYRVLTAKDAAAAERAYASHFGDVDLLLTDVVLPGENGRAFAGRLLQGSPELRVLLISGYGDQIRAQEPKIGACLAKPFSAAVLLQKVRQLLDGAENSGRRTDPVKPACGNA
jgi:CheY-like chemotaxis protein